jgi:hypothetical protein
MSDGVVDGSGPVQTIYGAAPRDTFPALATSCLTGIAALDATHVQVTDACAGHADRAVASARRAVTGFCGT